MKEVTISIPKEKTDQVTQFLENEIKINSIIFLTGQNCNQFIIYLPQSKVGDFLKKLELIGCGVNYGLVKISNINALKPIPKQTNTLSFHPGGTLSLEQVYSSIVANISLTKDFTLYTLISSLIASLGLATDNVLMVAASMFLSPIMTPILGIAMGLVIKDYFLIKKSIKTELFSWLIIFFAAFFLAIPMGHFADDFDWPTDEMSTRGRNKDVIMGVLFAIPSGVAVGLSVTTGGINNLVGVAVAAALVPVLSNSGLLLSHALMRKIYLGQDDLGTDYADIGFKSLAIFLINVILIAGAGMVVFILKGVKKFRRTSVNWKFPKITPNGPKNLVEKFDLELNQKEEPHIKLKIMENEPSRYTEKEIQCMLNADDRLKHLLKRFFKKQVQNIRRNPPERLNDDPALKKLKRNLEDNLARQLNTNE